MRLILLISVVVFGQAAATVPTPPVAREIARDTYLVPGAVPPDRGPDGNTVIFVAPKGLIVVDTGRHPWHSDGILNFARDRNLPVSAIINTHWHLDHASGNGRIKAVHPAARVHTTKAVDRALASGGFLARNYAATLARPLDKMPATQREETELFIATMKASDLLRPDVPIERSATLDLAGRRISARVAANAVTDADVWLYDDGTGVAVIGDLVTFPAPFFESACPAPWERALDDVWASPFKLAIPGHGEPMTREQFDSYRGAFKRFRSCVGGDSPSGGCAAGWTKDVASFLKSDAERRQATEYASYYTDFLRKGGGASADCLVK
jgi:glyoxylase-like metal-dependent hydrolase (beta-lactamase superfamily II)